MGFFVSSGTVDCALDLGWIDSTPVCFLAPKFLDAEDVCGFILRIITGLNILISDF